ncbi:hypothetical protein RA19_13610 [Leisingera sp. ANG-M1]|uniref:hypothetical protein n=1 Tax=Leisingera sp. ANG-M1 TaxID=1577895 RepID=UPI00057E4AE2|nr:hypothetical protein [Leisingera sp. ANG-M1]KIC09807.1 hypothetical protein RA19_13610 [Leisingera sp. ANG-M1]
MKQTLIVILIGLLVQAGMARAEESAPLIDRLIELETGWSGTDLDPANPRMPWLVHKRALRLGVSHRFSEQREEVRTCDRLELRFWNSNRLSCWIVVRDPQDAELFTFYWFGIQGGPNPDAPAFDHVVCKRVARLGRRGWIENTCAGDQKIRWRVANRVARAESDALIARVEALDAQIRTVADLAGARDITPVTGQDDGFDQGLLGRLNRFEDLRARDIFWNTLLEIYREDFDALWTCDGWVLSMTLSTLDNDGAIDADEQLERNCLSRLHRYLEAGGGLDVLHRMRSRRVCARVVLDSDGPADFAVSCDLIILDTDRLDQPHYEPWTYTLRVVNGYVEEQCWHWKPIQMGTGQVAETATPLTRCGGLFTFVW